MNKQAVILLDTECTMCSKLAAFIINNGGEHAFLFISLYSKEGKALLIKHGLPENYNESVVLIRNEKVYMKSSAVFQIIRRLKGYKIFYIFIIIPRCIRDFFYDIIARNRHRL